MRFSAFASLALFITVPLTGCEKQIQKRLWFYKGYVVNNGRQKIEMTTVEKRSPSWHRAIQGACRENVIFKINPILESGVKIVSGPQQTHYKKIVRQKNNPYTHLGDKLYVDCFAEGYILEGPVSKLNKKFYIYSPGKGINEVKMLP